MVCGCDVTHNVGDKGASIAAMVGSLDYHMTDYAHQARLYMYVLVCRRVSMMNDVNAPISPNPSPPLPDGQARVQPPKTSDADPGARRSTRGSLQGREIIQKQEMKDMMNGLIKVFYEVNGCVPKKIVLLRDGVSAGEFEKVRQTELGAIRELFEENEQTPPKVTIVVSQKRTHQRFFPHDADQSRNGGKGKGGSAAVKCPLLLPARPRSPCPHSQGSG